MGAMAPMGALAGKLPGMSKLNKLPGMGFANKATNALTFGKGVPGLSGVPGMGGPSKGLARSKAMKAAPGQLTPQTAMGGQMAGPQGLMAGGAGMGLGMNMGQMTGQPTAMPAASQQMTPGAAAQGAFKPQQPQQLE